MQLQLYKIPFNCCMNSVYSKIPIPPLLGQIVHSVHYKFLILCSLLTIPSAETYGSDQQAVIRGSEPYLYQRIINVCVVTEYQSRAFLLPVRLTAMYVYSLCHL